MNSRFLSNIMAGMLILAAQPSFAAANSDVSGLVLSLEHYAGHSGILIKLDQQMIDPENCGRNDWYMMPDSSPRAQFVQALLLTAQSSQRRVYVTLNGCLDGMPQVIAVRN